MIGKLSVTSIQAETVERKACQCSRILYKVTSPPSGINTWRIYLAWMFDNNFVYGVVRKGSKSRYLMLRELNFCYRALSSFPVDTYHQSMIDHLHQRLLKMKLFDYHKKHFTKWRIRACSNVCKVQAIILRETGRCKQVSYSSLFWQSNMLPTQ